MEGYGNRLDILGVNMKKLSSNLGKKAEDFILDFLSTHSKKCFISRFSDTYDANKGRWGNPSIKKVVLEKKPCDAIMTWNGVTYYLEVKATENIKGLTSSLFSQQKWARTRVEAADGIYLYLIYSYSQEKWYWIKSTELNEKASWEELNDKKFYIDFPKVPL